MEIISVNDLSFSYPNQNYQTLNKINLKVNQGDFIVLTGLSGSGKTTLLKQLKPLLSPFGNKSGEIFYKQKPIETLSQRQQASLIGYLQQNPDNQIVCDKVWHELAYGLENLGYSNQEITLKVAEVATFFGIENWFYQDVSTLSGGQKQKLNLASIMTLQPEVIILDEPTSQLDPIATNEFLDTLYRINQELGITIIMCEHNLEKVISKANKLAVIDQGEIISFGDIKEVSSFLAKSNQTIFNLLPVQIKAYKYLENKDNFKISIKDMREWLNDYSQKNKYTPKVTTNNQKEKQVTVKLKDIYFKYNSQGKDVINNLSFNANSGELLAILGGNGTGKTTTLSLIADLIKPYKGSIYINDKNLNNLSSFEKYNNLIGYLPQDPLSLFTQNSVLKDLENTLVNLKLPLNTIKNRIETIIKLCELEPLLHKHPFDLSGGEVQRLALAKILLKQPKILLLDEPTKGLDFQFKTTFANIIEKLKKENVTIIMVSHDLEFCAKYADQCALFFNGEIVSYNQPEIFFANNNFYTTTINIMTRNIIPETITLEDLVWGFKQEKIEFKNLNNGKIYDQNITESNNLITKPKSNNKHKLNKRTFYSLFLILLLIPLTIFIGIYYLNDRKYQFISMLIILETMLPFALIYEGKKPQARELVVIATLSALAVVGRAAFFMLPQFKPVAAIVIISAIAFGPESGFLVGAMTMLLSNMIYGQGPWTPWQMFAMGIIGFLAGFLYKHKLLKRNKLSMAIFGGLATFFIYGGIMNPASIIMFQQNINKSMIITSYISGIPFDLIHALATVIFMLLIGETLLEKLDRIKTKYGLIDN